MDVLPIPKTENVRLLYNTNRLFSRVPIAPEQAKFRFRKVSKRGVWQNTIRFIVTNDSRTTRHPHPELSGNDASKPSIETGKVADFIKFDVGNAAIVVSGQSTGVLASSTSARSTRLVQDWQRHGR